MRFHVITLFPESIEPYVESSILGRARAQKLIEVRYYDPRDFSEKQLAYVDGKPYGGGPGMVLQALPFVCAAEKALAIARKKSRKKPKVILLSPGGKPFDNTYARKLAKLDDVVLLAGRYEGLDARVKKILKAEEVSVGPYVLTGGELPAAIIIDATARQLEGVLGNFDSLEDSRTASSDVYTRPEVLEHNGKKYRVPGVLLSGNHAAMEVWRKAGKNRRK